MKPKRTHNPAQKGAAAAKRKIKAWKGGRCERIYARMTPEAKTNLLDRVMREGYKTLADWLEAQAMPLEKTSCRYDGKEHVYTPSNDRCVFCDQQKPR